MSRLSDVNKSTYRRPRTVRFYSDSGGYITGERAAFDHVTDECRHQAILDIGVGAGRTTPLLRQISDNYVGIDFVEEMVNAAGAKYPAERFEVGDARALRYPDRSFKLAIFSANGIDNVMPDDRMKVLKEIWRVLQWNGLFVMCALHRDGPSSRERWWHLGQARRRRGWRGALGLYRAIRYMGGGIIRRDVMHRMLLHQDPDLMITAVSAHNFGLLNVLIKPELQIEHLRDTGFTIDAVYDDTGRLLDGHTDRKNVDWFHYIARKPEHDQRVN